MPLAHRCPREPLYFCVPSEMIEQADWSPRTPAAVSTGERLQSSDGGNTAFGRRVSARLAFSFLNRSVHRTQASVKQR